MVEPSELTSLKKESQEKAVKEETSKDAIIATTTAIITAGKSLTPHNFTCKVAKSAGTGKCLMVFAAFILKVYVNRFIFVNNFTRNN